MITLMYAVGYPCDYCKVLGCVSFCERTTNIHMYNLALDMILKGEY